MCQDTLRLLRPTSSQQLRSLWNSTLHFRNALEPSPMYLSGGLFVPEPLQMQYIFHLSFRKPQLLASSPQNAGFLFLSLCRSYCCPPTHTQANPLCDHCHLGTIEFYLFVFFSFFCFYQKSKRSSCKSKSAHKTPGKRHSLWQMSNTAAVSHD